MNNEVITLVAETQGVDEYGDITTQESERKVFARLESITQSEFYQASAVGIKPELKFVLSDYLDYQNEEILRYQSFNSNTEETFKIIRTYRKGNSLELVCKRGVD